MLVTKNIRALEKTGAKMFTYTWLHLRLFLFSLFFTTVCTTYSTDTGGWADKKSESGFNFSLSQCLLLAEIKKAGYWLQAGVRGMGDGGWGVDPITHNPSQLCSVTHQRQYNKSASSGEPYAAQVGKVVLSRLCHHTSPSGVAGRALQSDSALICLLFATDSSRHHCLIECSWSPAIFPLFLPPSITRTEINLPSLAEELNIQPLRLALINTSLR